MVTTILDTTVYKEGGKGRGGGEVPMHVSAQTLKRRNNSSRSRFMEISEVKGKYMAGPVQNTAVSRVYDELLQ